MAVITKIQWTSHTFNPWRGCAKVSPGCENCYAEALSHRNPNVLGEWGPKARRAIASKSYWYDPVVWNRDAREAEERRRVFCASLADVFEDRADLDEPRCRLLGLIARTPWLDWLLLTKRPECIRPLLERAAQGPRPTDDHIAGAILAREWLEVKPPANVWLGVSVEDQKRALERIPLLLEVPAVVRFLSCEPLLGPIDFTDGPLDRHLSIMGDWSLLEEGIHWVILGGESGSNARPLQVSWMRDIIWQCQRAAVAVFVKQLGSEPWLPGPEQEGKPTLIPLHLADAKGGDPGEWPHDLRIRELPYRMGRA